MRIAALLFVFGCSADQFTDGGDATTDATTDTPTEGATPPSDASSGSDASTGDASQTCPYTGGSAAPCGQESCNVTSKCCISANDASCDPTCATDSITCRTSKDCLVGDSGLTICCLEGNGVSPGCPTTISGTAKSVCTITEGCGVGGDVRMCAVDSDCPNVGPTKCDRAAFAINLGYTFGICLPP